MGSTAAIAGLVRLRSRAGAIRKARRGCCPPLSRNQITAEALIAQRKSDQILARTDAERGKELVAKGYLSKQVDDQRSAKADAADAALRAAQAQRDQAQFAIHASEADAEQIKAILTAERLKRSRAVGLTDFVDQLLTEQLP